ncbi:MAG: hypothetical protein PHP04_01265 [Bacteroidales bacterium]|nr:hypothetical protein [Bacteroidales bacterium]
MKKMHPVLLALLIFSATMQAQTTGTITGKTDAKATKDKKSPLFGIVFSGYVKTDFIFDSRQTVNFREGHFLLFPENEKPDEDGTDINAKANFNILSIQTRLAGSITGPDALGAKTSAYFEAEFFGNINPNINTFRLRHAWIKLNWTKTELMMGQSWHPMFVPECSPGTVSFNTGAPFVVFSRNPQLRITQKFGKFSLQFSALEQIDFMSTGPDGISSKYLRNSVLPELNLLLQYGFNNPVRKTEFLIGASVNYFMLTPRLQTEVTLSPARDTVINNIVYHTEAQTSIYKTSEKSRSMGGSFFVKVRIPNFTFKAGAVYGDDNYAYTMLGGYAVKSIKDAAKGFVDYANVRSWAAWGEIHTNGTRWQPGLFGAFGQNLGATSDITGPYYARGNNIAYAYRISPRLIFNVQKLRFAGEIEYTVAAYGTVNNNATVSDAKEVGNFRILLGAYYFF